MPAREILVHTVQHNDRGMSAIFTKSCSCGTDYNSASSGSHASKPEMLIAIEEVCTRKT
jgi:hypothetical protein